MPTTLKDQLVLQFPLAKMQTLRDMIKQGRVVVDGQTASRLTQAVDEGARVSVRPTPKTNLPTLDPLERVFEDADILVVNKPAGLLTSTVPSEPRLTAAAVVTDYLARTAPTARSGVIHRLDADASGLLVFSKNREAFESLKAQFFHHTVERQYLAVVEGIPAHRARRIESHLLEQRDGRVHSVDASRGQHAVTHYELVEAGNARAMLRVTLHTGRKHQIRAHLSECGHPVAGDVLYGKLDESPRPRELLLRAVKLAFDHPRRGKRMVFELPTPREFTAALKSSTQRRTRRRAATV